MIDKTTAEAIALKCDQPLNNAYLDLLHQTYNEGSPREDWPNYYRFLYFISNHLDIINTDGRSIFIELGCHYGAASLHFIAGGMRSLAYGIDVVDRIKPVVKNEDDFLFMHGRTDNPEFHKSFHDKKVDVLLIDSDHSYKTTADEFRLWEPKVKPGGLILFDDIDAPEYADGCGKFFRELAGEKLSLPHLHPENWGFGVWFKKNNP